MNNKFETLDIVNLIEQTPMIKMSNNYQGKYIEKIQKKFTDSQQQIFLTSFYSYINFNSKTDFIIDLNHIWKWLGFSRKDHCKVVLENIDYKIINNIQQEKTAPPTCGAAFSCNKLH